ncbi:hypothetical protein A3C09_01375 [Candidatus Uhrbacteria bacterium RIFCSPHIGHO2_02_FULL_47_44]|uniref:Uncharacterized protein n=1 Tax=Candidatus Uhrbacteria bacterium RIFCSPLOWO2_02_FULL_48_18 TaxID=1802408 RepID=A0A1F7V919_9BACT|nr:MAG: hypothetical protein A2839_00840 [Candidatus Uhrbacteria bacterium RIFCSPHIGHO2_01_FULL_47_10]OGL69817.1 MAG: hypothetical protein A3C09_01375 [Candidatus Uhrbacteria bacterium RIFCSPHIGHO2_02_FULL_47_44]OGL77436.1 MAG: hypothetical protein A3E97_00425 [Candidatus Uhrbacteria bacterium RIFCSPHIGHO2_12_FULL_47_12]OGL81798.1 MAG: hypothetical protein A3B20_01740 [Candidatus Uhrbacteria bacterium RIFCSPLOWO2_01_FULL_47_17]OGL86961.1 MAG: hypothetical protein A3I41_03330 [Candidatus Uhrbact
MATKKAVTTKKTVKKMTVASESVVPALTFAPLVISPKKSAKKSSAKKSAAKKSSKKPEVIVVEEVTLGAKESLKLPYEVSKEYVIVHRCTNCEHVPFSISKLVTLFSVLIMLLSVSVLIQVGTIDISKIIAFVSPVVNAASAFANR